MSAPREHALLLAKHAVRKMLAASPSQIETVLAQIFQDVIDATEKDETEACADIAKTHGEATGEKAARDIEERIRERAAK